jgi:predicted nucleotidyltransferase/DNA-binding XRE family transcriptional regulator
MKGDQTAAPEALRGHEQERLVLEATDRISEAMEEAGISKADLARMLGTSRAHVSTLLSGERNMTLRTLADLAYVLGRRVEISLEPLPSSTAAGRLPVSPAEIARFCRRHHIRRLALFGSVLRDDFGPESDVDVLVEFEPEHTPGFGFIDVQDQLTAMLGRTVDLNTPQDLSPYFRDEVIRTAEVLYDANTRHAA